MPSETLDGERRQVTVLFCDLVGSTALSERLDPEELREVVHGYCEACADVIRAWGGHVDQFLGDGVVAFFGYPSAQEDAGQRAVRAGLGLLEVVRGLASGNASEPLQVRVGIHTGLVVVGGKSRGREIGPLAVGGAPNVAARIQAAATPGAVVVGASTYRLVSEFFTCRALGPHTLKGISEPIELYQVLGESGVESRFEAAMRAGLVPLVGRSEELALLVKRWEAAKGGHGQATIVSGDAGIGKSRLLQALRTRIADDPHLSIECFCTPHHRNSALYPVIVHLQELVQFERDDAPDEKLAKLERTLAPSAVPAETLPLFAALLSLPHPERCPPLSLTAASQRQRTLEALVGWLLERSRRDPVQLVVEDLQWADPSTLELLGLLIERCSSARIAIVMTHRPDFRSPWNGGVTHVALSRLERTEVQELIDGLTGGKALPAQVLPQIIEKTDGVPLFVEELTKMVLESGWVREHGDRYELSGPLPPLAIPATLQDSLMARLDQLAAARPAAQLGALLGREFTYELIRAVWQADEATLQRSLDELIDAELLLRGASSSEARYVFKHALIQDAAYQSLLKSSRQQLHERIAVTLEERFQDVATLQPELVAHHYLAAARMERSIPFSRQAGLHALQRSAYLEAVHHFSAAIEALTTLPDSRERNEHELALRLCLGVGLIVTKGYTAPEVEQSYSRAEVLCRALGDTRQQLPALYGLWTYHMLRDDRDGTLDLADRLQQLGAGPAHTFIAASARGITAYWIGDFTTANTHLSHAVELYDRSFHQLLAQQLGEDAPLLAHLYYVWTLLHVGRPDLAKTHLAATRDLVERLSSPYAMAATLNFEMQLWLTLCDVERTRQLADQVRSLSIDQHFPFFVASATCAHGWTLIQDGALEAGKAEIRHGLSIFELSGATLPRTYWLGFVAEALLADEQQAEGLAVIDEALAISQAHLNRSYDADSHRVRGELLLLTSASTAAETSFRRALEIARGQGGRLLELRAAVGLARFLRTGGRASEAHVLLSEVCGRFGEGLEWKELDAARRLVSELS